MQSTLEVMEDQCFKIQDVMESYHRLARTFLDQLVTGECLELLRDLGEQIQASAAYSDYIYRHPEEWDTYMDEREEAAMAGLMGGD